MNKPNIIFYFFSILLFSCGIYSFNGASIPKNAETVSVDYFINSAPTKQPTLSQVLSERLKDFFTTQTNLIIAQNNGDLNFTGEIIKYEIKPIAIQSNETAGQNRLTISIKVNFKNSYNNEFNFEHTFSRYRDYESSQNFSEIENLLIEEISTELIEDIFNKAVVNW
ncbi:MAG: LPS assembly lipoprotein LptE [Flavobacteriales bacterium]|nr:LPS assembly lipoprotein LptE [Flavobacteriales bacterium]